MKKTCRVLISVVITGLSLLQSWVETADSRIVGWPNVTLPGQGNAVLTGVTILYEEPSFLAVNKSIDAYLGVRFAHPPVGELRFADPVPYAIHGEFDATKDGAVCTQLYLDDDAVPNPIFPGLRRNIDEDCLYLSIYTPSPKVRGN